MNDAELVAALAEQTRAALDRQKAAYDLLIDDLRGEVKGLRELVAAIPTGKDGRDGRDGEPGPPGERGPAGKDGASGVCGEKGLDGKDGRDGRDGKDGSAIITDEMRALVERSVGERVEKALADLEARHEEKVAELTDLTHKGLWENGKDYRRGQYVTWGGSTFVAMKDHPEGKPGDSSSWFLAARRGRDASGK